MEMELLDMHNRPIIRATTALVTLVPACLGVLALSACKIDAPGGDGFGAEVQRVSQSARELAQQCDAAKAELRSAEEELANSTELQKWAQGNMKNDRGENTCNDATKTFNPDCPQARTLAHATARLQSAKESQKSALEKQSKICSEAYSASKSRASATPAKVPEKGCYVFRGKKVVTVGGKDVALGDGTSAVPIYLAAIVQGPNNQGAHAVYRAVPKAGASTCQTVEVGFFANELHYPTPAEEKLCSTPCSAAQAAGPSQKPAAAPAAAAPASFRGCSKTQKTAFLYTDQYKGTVVRPASGTISPKAQYPVGPQQTYYAHSKAGNMVHVTIKTGTFRGRRGWLDLAEAHTSLSPAKVACPQ